jgi:hypothetical protein
VRANELLVNDSDIFQYYLLLPFTMNDKMTCYGEEGDAIKHGVAARIAYVYYAGVPNKLADKSLNAVSTAMNRLAVLANANATEMLRRVLDSCEGDFLRLRGVSLDAAALKSLRTVMFCYEPSKSADPNGDAGRRDTAEQETYRVLMDAMDDKVAVAEYEIDYVTVSASRRMILFTALSSVNPATKGYRPFVAIYHGNVGQTRRSYAAYAHATTSTFNARADCGV